MTFISPGLFQLDFLAEMKRKTSVTDVICRYEQRRKCFEFNDHDNLSFNYSDMTHISEHYYTMETRYNVFHTSFSKLQ